MCAAITTSAIGVGISGYMAYQGAQEKKDAKAALNKYERQTLDNAFESIQISTLGSDMLREEASKTAATLVDASQNAGSRGVFANVPRIQQGINAQNREAAIDLDNQNNRRQYAIANDNARIEGITENRDIQNMGALSSQYQSGKQDMWNGITGMSKAISTGLNSYQPKEHPYDEEVVDVEERGVTRKPMEITAPVPFSNFRF